MVRLHCTDQETGPNLTLINYCYSISNQLPFVKLWFLKEVLQAFVLASQHTSVARQPTGTLLCLQTPSAVSLSATPSVFVIKV